MLQVAVALYALAALGGLAMAGIRFVRHRNPPSWLAMAHGLLASAGLTLQLYASLVAGAPGSALLSALLFLLAAAVGVWLNLRYHEADTPLSKRTVLAHGAVAIVAFALLLFAAF
ncbi:hypothetical protein [Cognatilysobacter bugurensis]|uniref:Uncharacterized protein n=1 Tax=Cognatilysobacter bugurensis TaxID=543356 RepID=A0A918W653_9GAMM|nr:hypothetical protein [Lysobacter bugurensis]GHA72535.1 hypothetical protein GCM10007067_06310 [Lysobacter bugurensis]